MALEAKRRRLRKRTCLRPIISKKLLIWGAVGKGFKSKLVLIDKSVNSEMYSHEILDRSGFIDEAKTDFNGKFLFQQDNARAHVSRYTKRFMAARGVPLLPDWPPYSPDLNIIEVIWAIMKQRVQNQKPETIEELKEAILHVWDELSFETIDCLIASIPRRLEYVRNHSGLTCCGKI